jgi:hypothetical protein
MKLSTICRIAARPLPAGLALTVLSLAWSNAVVFAQQEKNSKSTGTAKPATSQTPTASPKPSPTPETKIDARTEAELLQAEDRFVIAIENRDIKELEELLHPQFADSIEGRSSAFAKRGFIMRASGGNLPVYRIEKERKLIRSGNAFTVEGLARDMSRDGWEERAEEWAHVRRLWEKQGTRWIAGSQIIAPGEEREAEKGKHDPEEKEKERK